MLVETTVPDTAQMHWTLPELGRFVLLLGSASFWEGAPRLTAIDELDTDAKESM